MNGDVEKWDGWRRLGMCVGQHASLQILRPGKEPIHGSDLFGGRRGVFSAVRLAHLGVGQTLGGVVMNAMYVIGAVLSLGLLVYLMIALLKAEWF